MATKEEYQNLLDKVLELRSKDSQKKEIANL